MHQGGRNGRQSGVPLELPDGLPGVGVEQQLVGIEAVAGGRLVGAMDAVTVDRARSRIRQIAVSFRDLWHRRALAFSLPLQGYIVLAGSLLSV
jgi:hypothetical protein